MSILSLRCKIKLKTSQIPKIINNFGSNVPSLTKFLLKRKSRGEKSFTLNSRGARKRRIYMN